MRFTVIPLPKYFTVFDGDRHQALNRGLERPQPGQISTVHEDSELMYAPQILVAHVEAVAGPAPEGTPTEVIALGRAITQGIADRLPADRLGQCVLRPGKTEITQYKVDEEEAYIIEAIMAVARNPT